MEPAPDTAAAPTLEPEITTVDAPAEGQAADEHLSTQKKRRRGTRGGRGRKRTTPAPKATADEPQPAERRQSQRTRSPRRQPPKRAPLPKAKRELLVSVDAGEKRVAVLEDDRVAEVYLERPEHRSIAGNIYLGIVDNVLPGMEAAFVEIGLEKNGFLYVDEIVGPELEGRKGARKIQDLIQRGQTVLVQAVKDPMKTKGARLTTEISLPGRFVVYVPHGDGLGVSRRLEDDERNRLKGILKDLTPKQGGVIVRTAAEGASAEDIARDLDFLERLWKTIEVRANATTTPTLIYQEAELPLRVTRDLFTGDFERLFVDNDRAYKRIVGYLKKTSPHMVERVERYRDAVPLMEKFGVEQEIRSTLNRRVDLPSGGYLIFDYAEAFTVIDVNTGRFVGSRSKKSAGRLEDTITKNNLEAVKEVVRQLRLRDVGGIIVIDFIDMANPKNREAVEEALRQELERDRTKTYVVEISPLGLVEMTRQNVTDGPREVMTRKCPTCGGDGIVYSEASAAIDVERRLRALVAGSRSQAYRVELAAPIAAALIGPGARRLLELEALTKRKFFLEAKPEMHLDHFVVLGEGKLAELAPAAPFAEGAELQLELVEVDRHDATAAVGKVDGFDVCAADASSLVGKRVKVRVERILDGAAYATLVRQTKKAPEPLTAEAEAEKPTRKPPARRDAEAAVAVDAVDDVDAVEAEPAEDVPEDETDAAEAAPAGPAKKKTRRGSRGGKNRKKAATKPATAAAVGSEPETAGQAEKKVTIHLPADDLGEKPVVEVEEPPAAEAPVEAPASENGDAPVPAKKKTRRGSRGGKNRRKRAAAGGAPNGSEPADETDEAVVEPVAEVAEPAEEPSTNGAPEENWGYVPMSEWEDEFKR